MELLVFSKFVVFAYWLFKGRIFIVANLEFFFSIKFYFFFLFVVLGIELKTSKPCLL